MGPDQKIFRHHLHLLSLDQRITVWHLAVFLSILQLAADGQHLVYISRKKVMQLAHINSIVTYHKCIRELQSYGYIRYKPSYHPGFRSTVYILPKQ